MTHRSSTTARIITALIGVIITPIALGIISAGGFTVYRLFSAYGFAGVDPVEFAGPVLLQLVGLVLLAGVVVTGVWSSAGLLATGVVGLVPLVFAAVPGLLIELYRSAPQFLAREWFDGILYGVPLVVCTALGAMGLALMLIRRSSRGPGAGSTVVGLIAAPVLLAIGGWLLAWGITEGQLRALVALDTSLNLLATLAVIAGVVLTIAGIGATRFTPWALLIPAAGLLLFSLLLVLSMSTPGFQGLIPPDVLRTGMPVVLMGATTAVAVSQIVFTVVAIVVGRRARGPVGPVPPAEYAPAPPPNSPPPPNVPS